MIPKIITTNSIDSTYKSYLKALGNSTYKGDIQTSYSQRLIYATDNSIYQILPQAILFPKDHNDIAVAFKLAQHDQYSKITFSPRGGGTGTNGQSLTQGIILDLSHYMNQILEINVEDGYARIQPGVILDQLNRALAPHNVFFAPTLSPSSRATLGGMFNTDASGKGSVVYGKTSQHILSSRCILIDGSELNVGPLSEKELSQSTDKQANIIKEIMPLIKENKTEIDLRFPAVVRYLTGYNLAKLYDTNNQIYNLNYLLSGSEGTLGVITELTVKLTPIPKQRKLTVLHYSSFADALADARELIDVKPSAVETMDENLVELAKTDPLYNKINEFITSDKLKEIKAISLVEFSSNDLAEIDARINKLKNKLGSSLQAKDTCIATKDEDINNLWQFRKKSVGLLGRLGTNRNPVAFVEDTVVPPENLADYIQEFRALLDKHKLQYGMFGHVDVGCLHVRPALDLTDPADEKLIRIITENVIKLLQKYNGVLWGEHGKGFRSEFMPEFFGEKLFQVLRKVKAIFDPNNRLNPGKLVVPEGIDAKPTSINSPMRGQFDRQVPKHIRESLIKTFSCNGNAACFNYYENDVMCPSYKGTKNRIHSPKGRAGLLREWLRQLSLQNFDIQNSSRSNLLIRSINNLKKNSDFSQDVYTAMKGCLGCKACASECPIHVNIPNLKANFLHSYYSRYRRSMRDYLIAHSEYWLYWQSRFTWFFNPIMTNSFSQKLSRKLLKIADIPKLATPTFNKLFSNIQLKNLEDLDKLSANEKQKSVALITDPAIAFYNTPLVTATNELLKKLNINLIILPYRPNGTTLHLMGFLDKFNKLAHKNNRYYKTFTQHNISLIGLDAATTLCFRDEYKETLKGKIAFSVLLIQEWLNANLKPINIPNCKAQHKVYYLLTHCTEKSLVPDAAILWQTIFTAFGLELKLVNTGCCGMAGNYGHEQEHFVTTKKIYSQSWQSIIENKNIKSSQLLATGFSCRAQAERFSKVKVLHPIELLNTVIL